MDFVSPVIELVNHVWDYSSWNKSYVCDLQENLDALMISMEELKNLRDHVKQRAELAEAEQMVRTPVVRGWLHRVEAVEAEVEEILVQGRLRQVDRRERYINTSCCCPKNCRSYKLGKKVVKKLVHVKELKDNGEKFDEVADRSTPVKVQGIPESPTVGMEPLLKMAMKLLEDAEVSTVGIYGMGGVGKTTLLKKINNQFLFIETNEDIDVVIWVVVSRELNLGRIQYEIAKRLGLPTQGEGDHQLQVERANAIFNILSRKKSVLSLDDCWDRVDLKSIGISHPNYHQDRSSNNSKVIFTTRSEVVCGLMEAKKKIRVECLDSEKAWQLFEEKVGEEALSSDPQVHELAKTVAKECCGLPLALITVGRTMAGKKTLQEWNHAIIVLKKYTSDFSGIGDEVFPVLKFSYENLQNDTLKSCFLYCSLYPEDFDIDKEKLIKNWIGEGFLDGFESMDEAYDKGHDIIGSLKAVSLLESGLRDSETQVKMHDVIRDLATWISSECGRNKDKLLVRAGVNLSEAPPSEKWKEAERVSLMNNYIKALGVRHDMPMTCSNLLTLLLNSNVLNDICDNFFQFMPNLKVLNLSRTLITYLPESISNLIELQFLDLSYTSLEELPTGLKILVKLTYLDLSHTDSLHRIPQGLISCLSNLQMLNLFNSAYVNWETEEYSTGKGASLLEVEGLKRLSELGLTTNSAFVVQKFLNNNKFQACAQHLSISSCQNLVSVDASSFAATTSTLPISLNLWGTTNLRSLWVSDCPSVEQLVITWVSVEKEIRLFSTLESLCLIDLPKLTIVWDKGLLSHYQCFQKLHCVCIVDCHTLKDLSWILYAPNLRKLIMDFCDGLESILNHEVSITDQSNEKTMNLFSRLKSLQLTDLPKLKSICGYALPFPSLQVISVARCPQLTKLPFDNNSAHNTLRRIEGSAKWWNTLQWEDDTVKAPFIKYFQPCIAD